jgi:hypothetical protein
MRSKPRGVLGFLFCTRIFYSDRDIFDDARTFGFVSLEYLLRLSAGVFLDLSVQYFRLAKFFHF